MTMTVSDLLTLLAEAKDPDSEVVFAASDYGEVSLAAGYICTDGTVMLVPDGEEELPLDVEDDEDTPWEDTGDDPIPARIASQCGKECNHMEGENLPFLERG